MEEVDHAGSSGQADLPPLTIDDDGVPYEDKLVEMMGKEGTPKPEGEAVKEEAAEAGKAVTPGEARASLFDLNGKLSLKAGEKLAAEHIKELERGWLREADYTRKTQELAQHRQEYQNVMTALDQIDKDPRYLRSYLTDQKILAAYHPQELLNIGLSGAGIPIQMWNEFLEWHAQNGGQFAGEASAMKADPYQQRFSQYDNEIRTLRQQLQGFHLQRQEDAHEREMSGLDKEVASVLTKFPGIKREELLGRMVWDAGPGKTPETLAKAIADEKEATRQEWLQGKELKQQKRVTSPIGTSVPIMPKAPKTWAEADEMTEQLYGARP